MEENKLNFSKSKILKIVLFFIAVVCVAIVFSRYLTDDEFQKEVDIKVFKKQIIESTSNTIEINSDSNPYIYAYSKYISVFGKNIFTIYDKDANVVTTLDMNITEPEMNSDENYLVAYEKNGSKLYLVENTIKLWEKDIDGDIYRASVNKNGYVVALIKNSTYKSVVIIYDNSGNELFRTFLATSYAICSEISEDNKYLAIGQIDYSGTIVKSVVKLISVENVKGSSQDSILYTYESEANKILNNLKFNTKDEVICMFDSYIQKISGLSDEKICDITNEDILVDVNLENNIVKVEKETSGLFSYQYQISLKNTIGKSDSMYVLENDIPKKMQVTKNLICVTLLNEVKIISSKGWLIKSYVTNTGIQDIVIGTNIVGIVYNNKIEIINT